MRRIILLATAAIFLASGRTGYPQEDQTFTPENQTVTQEKTPQLKWIYGSVAKVSFTSGYITVFSDQGYTTFKVTDKTAISIGPEKIGLEEINTEDSVRVQYYCPEIKNCVAISISESKKEEN